MQVSATITGLDEVKRAMLELPKRINRKILNDGLAAGANLIRDEARTIAPMLASPDPRWKPGALRKAIQTARIATSRAQYGGEVIVYVRKLSGRQIAAFKRKQAKRGEAAEGRLNPDDAFYWFFQEFGFTDPAGRKHAGREFLRRAFTDKAQQAVDVAIKIFNVRAQAEIAKLGRGF